MKNVPTKIEKKFSSLDEFISFHSKVTPKRDIKKTDDRCDYTQIGRQLVKMACRLIEEMP